MSRRWEAALLALALAAFLFAVPVGLQREEEHERIPLADERGQFAFVVVHTVHVDTFGYPSWTLHRRQHETTAHALVASAGGTTSIGSAIVATPELIERARRQSSAASSWSSEPVLELRPSAFVPDAIAWAVVFCLTLLWRAWLRRWKRPSSRVRMAISIALRAVWPFLVGLIFFDAVERLLPRCEDSLVRPTPAAVVCTIGFLSILIVLVIVRDRLSPPSDSMAP